MKKILIILILCRFSWSFEIEQGQKLNQDLTYTCDNELLEIVFLQSINKWNIELNNYFIIRKVNIDGVINIKLGKVFNDALGETYPYGHTADIIISDNPFYESLWDGIVLHEVGHALGLAHSEDPNAIMFHYLKKEPDLNQDDINGIVSIYGLSPLKFTFSTKIVKHWVTFSIDSLDADPRIVGWDFGDGTSFMGRSKIRHKYPKGVYNVEMTYEGLSTFKEIIIK